ncbi:manganese/iron transporter [Caballeronia pedi]|uniref:Manganese/iron transporter n=1 Tax=Caballeronia pedi TaxID=1777141 RepID=A0A158DT29_9BURK|nr:manganese/iron transporter [Caballeronia pedi]
MYEHRAVRACPARCYPTRRAPTLCVPKRSVARAPPWWSVTGAAPLCGGLHRPRATRQPLYRRRTLWRSVAARGSPRQSHVHAAAKGTSRVGVVTGRDLTQICRERYSRYLPSLLCVACRTSNHCVRCGGVFGSAVALQMLFGVSPMTGVLCSTVGTLAMHALRSPGRRPLQGTSAAHIAFVGFCFVVRLAPAHPVWVGALRGLARSLSCCEMQACCGLPPAPSTRR